jgi:penicillin-binding protein 1A
MKTFFGKLGKFFGLTSLIVAAGAILVGSLGYWWISRGLPPIISISDYKPLGGTRVFVQEDGKEVLIAEFFKERRYIVPFEKIPNTVVQAFLAAEDDHFFQHKGVNIQSILRAMIANIKAGQTVQGGSTITQQVAKSLFLDPDRNVIRKIRELILANRLETNLTKQQILFLYLNQIYLGLGAYGIQAAAQVYFKKDVSQLTLPEAALLAGLPKAPSEYNPFRNPSRAKERQRYVLRRMQEVGMISQEQMLQASNLPLRVYYPEELNTKVAPHLVEHIRKYLVEKYGSQMVLEEGLTVYVPSGPRLFKAARASLREGVRTVDRKMGYRGPVRRLTKAEEKSAFLAQSREALFRKKVPFNLVMPEGKLGPEAAMREASIKSDDDLIAPKEIYEGLVLAVDPQKKGFSIQVGSSVAILPWSALAWTTPGKPMKPVPDIVKEGDVVLVTLRKDAASKLWVADLEQKPKIQGALFSLESKTGYVLALEGGYDFEDSEFNRAIQAKRQPGSAYKPVIYAAAIENGLTPASVLEDSPLVFEDETSGKWKPTNYEEKFHGDTTLRQALVLSRNIPTIRLVEMLRVPYLIEYSKRLGMHSDFPQDLSISLGSMGVPLVELTRVYALFPRLGLRVEPIFIKKILDRDGKVIEDNPPNAAVSHLKSLQVLPSPSASAPPAIGADSATDVLLNRVAGQGQSRFPPDPTQSEQLMDPRVAYVMTGLMKAVVENGTGAGAKALGRVSAGKTGTTNEYRDAWYMGYTPSVVTGAWVGFDDQQTLGSDGTGGKAALPIWLGYMQEAIKNYPQDEDFVSPSGIVMAPMHLSTGKFVDPKSPQARIMPFIEGTEPQKRLGDTGTETQDSSSEFLKEDDDF